MVERGANDLKETLELLLFVLGALRCDEIQTDVILRVLWQVHVLHCCVCHVNLLLKAAFFLADFAHKHGHLTKDDGIVEDEADEDCKHIHDFEVGAGAHFVATECQDCHVEHDHVLVPLIHRLKVIEAFVADTLDIDEVEWRNPLLL